MKKIGDELRDMRKLVEDATIPPRKYERKGEKKNEKPGRARFKLVVWFKDRNKKTFYSYDLIQKPDKTYQLDEWNGLFKLERLVNTFGDKVHNAIIYANLDPIPQTNNSNYHYEVFIQKNGVKNQNPFVFFDETTNELKLDIIYKRIAFKKKVEASNRVAEAQKKLNLLNKYKNK